MKDMKEPNVPSTGSGEKTDRVVELTPDMELKVGTKGKIIDLTNSLHTPSEDSPQGTSEPQPIQVDSPEAAKALQDKLVIGTPAEVEADVDAAFNLMQEKTPDETPVAPEHNDTQEIKEDEIDLSDSLNDLSMDDAAPVPPVEETEAADIKTEKDGEPELELFQEPIVEPSPAPLAANQDGEASDEAPQTISDELEERLEGVHTGDTIELTDVVLPIDLGTPVESTGESEEKQDATVPPEQESDQIAADAIALDNALGDTAPGHFEAEEEETIELIDIVDEQTPSDEEEVIELTDIVSQEEMEHGGDDDVIELNEVVDPADLAAEAGDSQGALLSELDDEDDVIELTDIVSQEELNGLETGPEVERQFDDQEEAAPEVTNMDAFPETPPLEPLEDMPLASFEPADDQVIRLDSVLEHVRQNKSKIVENMSQSLEEAIGDPPSESDTAEGGIDMQEVREALGEPSELTDKELEEAIEKIIRTKYAETIEKHIATAVEKVVTREMESIKRDLMEDQDPDE